MEGELEVTQLEAELEITHLEAELSYIIEKPKNFPQYVKT